MSAVLTNTACKNAKQESRKYRLYDTGGLYMEVMPNGSKYWRLKYRYLGKEKLLALGVYPVLRNVCYQLFKSRLKISQGSHY
jgi:hypothetical protein